MWPPTNAVNPTGMMYGLSTAPKGPDGEYIVDNYLGSGYRIVAIATEFPDGDQSHRHEYIPWTFGTAMQTWGTGSGPWMVKYHNVSQVFWRLVELYTPAAVLTFSRDKSDIVWAFETLVRNNSNGFTDGPLGKGDRWKSSVGEFPYVGGAEDDPAAAPGRPNAGRPPILNSPPDTNIDASTGPGGASSQRGVQADSRTLIRNVASALGAAFPTTVLRTAELDDMGIYPDNFVSAYVGYHAVWYQSFKPSTCKFAFHTHVGYELPLNVCQRALCIQLATTITALGGTVALPCP